MDGSNKPTPAYTQLKNPKLKSKAIATAIKTAYAPLFDADEKANERSSEDLKGLVSQVSGADANTLSKIMGTLNALLKLTDSSNFSTTDEQNDEADEEPEKPDNKSITNGRTTDTKVPPPFHFNIQVHLPSSATEEVYLNIFNAIRKVFN